MDTRVNKYNENSEMSRVSKNEELYKQINDEELDNFSVRSNATVLGNQEQEIDIEKIKRILDKRYSEAPKRRSIRVEPREEESRISEEPTKEYDLNLVLEKAKDGKEESYEESRAKKLRNTQFDILKNLNLDLDSEDEEEEVKEEAPKSSSEDLMELINTITMNESKNKESKEESDPLDILSDLKGSDNTQVYESMSIDVSKVLEEQAKEEPLELTVKSLEKVKASEPTEEKEITNTIDNSFYTKNIFKKKDFENEDDFVENEKLGIGIKILIGLVIICFVVGLFLFLKSFLKF